MLNSLRRFKIFYNYKSMKKHELKIQLTEDEELIFNTFLKYREEMQIKTIFRVAGGWVRDKVSNIF